MTSRRGSLHKMKSGQPIHSKTIYFSDNYHNYHNCAQDLIKDRIEISLGAYMVA